MALHVIGWSGAKTDSTANEAAPTIADESVTPSATGNRYLVDYDCKVCWAAAYNDTITRARLVIPSLRDLGLPEVSPLNATAEPSAAPVFPVWGSQGPHLRANEGIGFESSNGASTADTIHAAVGLLTGIDPIPAGRRFSIRATGAQTLVASAWTTAALLFDQDLPAGKYGVIGIGVTCNDGAFARLVFPGSPKMRPGFPIGETIALHDARLTGRAGQFGLLGTFTDRAPPQLQILGSTAGAETPAVILDLVEMSRTV